MKATKEQKRKALKEKIRIMKQIQKRSGQIERSAERDGTRREIFTDYAALDQCERILNS